MQLCRFLSISSVYMRPSSEFTNTILDLYTPPRTWSTHSMINMGFPRAITLVLLYLYWSTSLQHARLVLVKNIIMINLFPKWILWITPKTDTVRLCLFVYVIVVITISAYYHKCLFIECAVIYNMSDLFLKINKS